MQAMQGDAGEPNDAAYPYGGGDIHADVDASDGSVHTSVSTTNNGNLAFSYSTNLRWSVPGAIEVGREQDARISGSMSIGDFRIGVDPLNHPFLTEDHEEPKVKVTFAFTLYKASGSGEPRSELETNGGEVGGEAGFQMGFDEQPGFEISSSGKTDMEAGARIDDNYLWYPRHWDTKYQHDYDIYIESWESRSEDFVAELKSVDGDGFWTATKSLPYETSSDTYYLVLSVDVPTAERYVRYFYEYDPSANASTTVVPDEPEPEPEPDEPSEPYDVVIDTDAPDEIGESDLGEMPWWIFVAGGATVAGVTGAVVSSNNRKRRLAQQRQAWQAQQQRPQPGWQAPPQAPEKPKGMSTFRMALYKEFGDTLYEGAPPQVLGALIEEVRPDGSVVDRPDMTAKISFGATENIVATALGMRGPYQSIEVSVPKCRGEGDHGTVSIAYQGTGGRLTNNVRFKIERPEIVMAPVGLTFIAERRQTLSTSFLLKGVLVPEGAEPVFDVEVSPSNIGPSEGGAYFTGARVTRDADAPDRLWSLTMTETGQKAQLPPGAMEIFSCHIRARIHHARGDQVVEGDTEVFRFVEGLRLDVEDIKCYAVDEQERYVEFRTRRDDETVAEFKRKYVEWAGEGPSPTKDYTIPEERTRIVRKVARSVIKVTLYAWGTEMRDGQEVVRPMNPLPDFGATKILFADVEGSGTLRDVNGRDTRYPCKTLDLGYFLKEIDYDDNTMTYHVVPKRGVLLPPNRTQVDVTVMTSWNGRRFTETRRVNATSMPRREDFLEREAQYRAKDAKTRQSLEWMRDKIAGSEWRKVEVGGDVTLTDTVNDMVEFTAEHPVVANIPIVGPSINAGQTVWRQLTSKRVIEYSEYGDLMPMAHYIQMMIDGYDERYGFHEPDCRRIKAIFEAYGKGQLGSAQAAELAMYSHDLEYCDAVRMTVKSWNHSYAMIGTRIAFALGTSGQSEWLFVPLAAIGAGMEGSIDYIDRGGNSMLEAFRVGCDRAGKSALIDIALGKAIETGLQWAGWFKGLAEDITKAATGEAKASLRQLAGWFNSARTGGRITGAAKGLEGQMRQARAVAKQATAEFRASSAAVSDEMLRRDVNYMLGRLEGRAKVDELRRLIGEGAGELTRFERRQIIYAIQSDKHAMRTLMEMTGPEATRMRSLFSREIAQAQERALHMTRVRIAERYGIPVDEVRLVKTSGNKTAEVASGNKVSMDLDATFRRKVVDADGTVRWVDIDEAVGQPLFDEELFRVVHGYEAASSEEATAFAKGADHTIVDALGKESYGTYEDAMRVVNASRAGEALDNPELVGQVAEYKCSEWLTLARQASEQAKALSKAGDAKAAQWLASRSEAFIEESCRSFTKQADRIVTEKLLALRSRGIELGADIQPFLNKMEVLRNSGLGKAGGMGATSAEVEGILRTRFGSSLSETYHELNELTVRLDGMLRGAK